ncbi:MAG TPA: segregation/condensation protein A [Longimicrobiales bacterium]|nr:segregation/condensation protein A [Longimicrobiales bacterium]
MSAQGSLSSPFTEKEGFWVVDIDRFQGPLDLLLHLIRVQDIDVFDIPISRITDQFLKAVKGIQATQLDSAGEFLEMAASLVRIKAQMLLPRYGDEDELDPRAELVRRLLEYEQIREISNRLQIAETERGRRFPKGYVEARPRPSLEDTPLLTTWEDVFQAALGVEMPDPRDVEHRVLVRPVAMEAKVSLILDTLAGAARVEFSRLLMGIDEIQAKMHGVMTLLASLELARRRTIFMRQVRPFSELWIYRRDEEEEEAAELEHEPGSEPPVAPEPGAEPENTETPQEAP